MTDVLNETQTLALEAMESGDSERAARILRAGAMHSNADFVEALSSRAQAAAAASAPADDVYTPEELKNLTRAEYRANQEKVEKSMAQYALKRR